MLCLSLSSTLTSVALAVNPSSTHDLALVVEEAGFNFRSGIFMQGSGWGGVIYANDRIGAAYLLAAPADAEARYSYARKGGTLDGASNNGLFAGIANTDAITAVYPEGNAAAACKAMNQDDSSVTFYSPSLAELILMYQNAIAVTAAATANGGGNFVGFGTSADCENATYWSSTEAGENTAWAVNFCTGLALPLLKTLSLNVRCVAKLPYARTFGIIPNFG